MDDGKGTDTPQALERIGYTNWERQLFGNNSVGGTLRVLALILAFVVVFGILFQLAG